MADWESIASARLKEIERLRKLNKKLKQQLGNKMRLQEVTNAFIEMYGDADSTAKDKLSQWWESVDFVSSEDPYIVAEEAASSSFFTDIN